MQQRRKKIQDKITVTITIIITEHKVAMQFKIHLEENKTKQKNTEQGWGCRILLVKGIAFYEIFEA